MSRYPADRNPQSGSRRWQVHGTVQSLPDNRTRDWFDWACVTVMVLITVGTVGTVVFIYWSAK